MYKRQIFALTTAEDIWRGMEKCLYGKGKTLHFSKHGDLTCIRAKQINRGIPISVKDVYKRQTLQTVMTL